MALTEEEVKALEKEADLTRRRNVAAADLKDARGTAGMQRAYNQMRAESDMAAHERFMERRRAFAERNPLAIPGEERRRLLGQQDKLDLRAHEMSMLDKRNANSLAIAQENRGAAREQGMEAAKINAEVKNTELKNQLTMHEQSLKNALELADKKGALDKELETIRTQGALNQTAIKNKHEADIANAKNANDLKVAQANANATVQAAKHKAEGDKELAKARLEASDIRTANNVLTRFLDNPTNKRKWDQMSEEQKAAWFADRNLVNPL